MPLRELSLDTKISEKINYNLHSLILFTFLPPNTITTVQKLGCDNMMQPEGFVDLKNAGKVWREICTPHKFGQESN